MCTISLAKTVWSVDSIAAVLICIKQTHFCIGSIQCLRETYSSQSQFSGMDHLFLSHSIPPFLFFFIPPYSICLGITDKNSNKFTSEKWPKYTPHPRWGAVRKNNLTITNRIQRFTCYPPAVLPGQVGSLFLLPRQVGVLSLFTLYPTSLYHLRGLEGIHLSFLSPVRSVASLLTIPNSPLYPLRGLAGSLSFPLWALVLGITE